MTNMENLREVTALDYYTDRVIRNKVAEFGIYTNVKYKRVTCAPNGVWVTITFDEKPNEASFHLTWKEIQALRRKECGF